MIHSKLMSPSDASCRRIGSAVVALVSATATSAATNSAAAAASSIMGGGGKTTGGRGGGRSTASSAADMSASFVMVCDATQHRNLNFELVQALMSLVDGCSVSLALRVAR